MKEKTFQTNTAQATSNLNSTIGTSTADSYSNYCSYRLPCGVCIRTNAMCPKQYSPSITWTTSTNPTITNF